MIDQGENRWIHAHDLESDPDGREDTAEHKAVCLQYLAAAPEIEAGVHRASLARRVQAELAAVRVRASATARPPESELEKRLAQANATIDRLLAFVPARAPEIRDERLEQIVVGLVRVTTERFPAARMIVPIVSPEMERDTEACHRITLKVEIPDDTEPNVLAEGIHAAHAYIARSLSLGERQAVRLIVTPLSTSQV